MPKMKDVFTGGRGGKTARVAQLCKHVGARVIFRAFCVDLYVDILIVLPDMEMRELTGDCVNGIVNLKSNRLSKFYGVGNVDRFYAGRGKTGLIVRAGRMEEDECEEQ